MDYLCGQHNAGAFRGPVRRFIGSGLGGGAQCTKRRSDGDTEPEPIRSILCLSAPALLCASCLSPALLPSPRCVQRALSPRLERVLLGYAPGSCLHASLVSEATHFARIAWVWTQSLWRKSAGFLNRTRLAHVKSKTPENPSGVFLCIINRAYRLRQWCGACAGGATFHHRPWRDGSNFGYPRSPHRQPASHARTRMAA